MALVYVVEDDMRIGMLLCDILEDMGHAPTHCPDTNTLRRAMKQEAPDLLLLDLMLRGESGYDILQDWKQNKRTLQIPVIILSARSAEEDKVRGLDLGAEDYVTKPFGKKELQARIRTVLRRAPQHMQSMQFGNLSIDVQKREVKHAGNTIALTFREFELLYYLASHPGQVIDRVRLLRQVWGYQFEDDPSRTVDYHVKVLRKKLGDNPVHPRYLETVRGAGYRFIAKEAP